MRLRLLFAFSVLVSTLSAREYERAFTSSDGKILRATLVNASDGKVTLERAGDRRQFTLPTDRLSEADQAYIKNWQLKDAPVVHPLGWKRLRLHLPAATDVTWGDDRILLSAEGEAEIYLPVGAWLRFNSRTFLQWNSALKQFGGEPDWYISNGGDSRLTISTELGKPGAVVGFELGAYPMLPGGDRFASDDESGPLTIKEALVHIKAGSSVACDEEQLVTLMGAGANPSAVILSGDGSLPWSEFPSNLQALHRRSRSPIDFTGIEALPKLEMLSVDPNQQDGSGHAIQKTAHLAKLPKLANLILSGAVPNEEFEPLGELRGLRHLTVFDSGKEYPVGILDFLGKLGGLERARFPHMFPEAKAIDPSLPKQCSKLTQFGFTGFSWEPFVADLPNLTQLNLVNRRGSRESVHGLMEEGHFKHVQELAYNGHYTLNNFPQLRTITVMGGQNVAGLANSGPLPKLRTLDLESFSPEEIAKLGALPVSKGVERVELTRDVSVAHLAALADFPALKELALDYQFSEGAKVIDLNQLPGLRSLSIRFAQRSGAIESITGMRGLCSLKLDDCSVKQIGDRAGCPSLRFLTVENDLTLASLAGLGKCPNLERLYVHTHALLNSAGLENSPYITSAIIFRAGTLTVHKVTEGESRQ